jgi:hypothetical protein
VLGAKADDVLAIKAQQPLVRQPYLVCVPAEILIMESCA